MDKNMGERQLENVEEEDSLLNDVVTEEQQRLEKLEEEDKRNEIRGEETTEVETEESEEDVEQRKEKVSELRERQKQAQGEIEKQTEMQTVSEFLDENGNTIPARKKGRVKLKMLNIEDEIMQVKRFRKDDSEVYGLQDSIKRYGMLEPVQVVPYGDYYLLLQGYRRLQASINLGFKNILAVVDSTIPPELAKYYQVEMNNVLKYAFDEKLKYGKFVENTQRNLGVDAIEQSLGLKAGEYLKMKYIEQFKNDFPDIYKQVETEKLSVEQGYKKIDKEIEKQEKELDNMDALNSGELDDQLRSDDLADIQGEANQQELGKRKILDASTRRYVESRAEGKCECCGYGEDEPDLMVVFKVHHIIPVQFGGSDSKVNLILLCNNCHELVHKYERAEFLPEQDTYDRRNDIKRIVVLGNIILRVRKKAIHLLRTKYHEVGAQVDKGVLTIGQGIQKAKMNLRGEEEYNGAPYNKFYEITESLAFGGDVEGELAGIGFGSETKEDAKEKQVKGQEEVKEGEATN